MPQRLTNMDVVMELGKVIQGLENLGEKVDHNCKQSLESDEKILKKIDEVQKDFKDNYDKHNDYHKQNEEKWGVFMYVRNHMRTTIITAIILGIILSTFFGFTISKVVAWVRSVNAVIP
uniref:Uncharacterized protein n=1 Tax=viral metagenome TaxID=1070528 RepID=A0A6M3JV01_9ZZZZ